MRLRILLAILTTSAAPAQQGAAEAVVARIPAASIPSTVILSASAAGGIPGGTVSLPMMLSLAGTTAPGSLQFEMLFDSTALTFVSAPGLSVTVVSPGDVRLSAASPNGFGIGVVGSASFRLAAPFGPAAAAVNLVNCRSADSSGTPLSTACAAGSVSLLVCTVTGDAIAGVADIQAIINQALGVTPAFSDLNDDGAVNVTDIERVVAAVLRGQCLY